MLGSEIEGFVGSVLEWDALRLHLRVETHHVEACRGPQNGSRSGA
jgi:hypothetical protein